jgi:threonine synthase
VHYLSTRGDAPVLGFIDALLTGLARDGGLYVPQAYPQLADRTIAAFAGAGYASVARQVIAPFVGDELDADDLGRMIKAAYAGFRHTAVAPLVQIDDNLFVLELFHGPTLAFKDVAMQLLGRLMDRALATRGTRATIVGATSGDTGAAAIAAFRGSAQVDVFILYPHGRVSEVQRRQMTTVAEDNVHAIAIEGTFDDCQAILKGLFNHHAFRDEIGLSGVNSINWARIVAQIVYYFTGAVALGAPHRKVSFSVPTGNFGDVLAGYVAKRMGLPISRLVVATNANDILARALASGLYEVRGVQATYSPSMDIQVSSNFERLLFDVHDRDPAAIRALMGGLAQSGGFRLAEPQRATIDTTFEGAAVSEAETLAEIGKTYRETGQLLDPHTAVATAAARRALQRDTATSMIALSTAHPAKFPDAVEKATGRRPALPDHLADLLQRQERFSVLPNDAVAVEQFIRARRLPALGEGANR